MSTFKIACGYHNELEDNTYTYSNTPLPGAWITISTGLNRYRHSLSITNDTIKHIWGLDDRTITSFSILKGGSTSVIGSCIFSEVSTNKAIIFTYLDTESTVPLLTSVSATIDYKDYTKKVADIYNNVVLGQATTASKEITIGPYYDTYTGTATCIVYIPVPLRNPTHTEFLFSSINLNNRLARNIVVDSVTIDTLPEWNAYDKTCTITHQYVPDATQAVFKFSTPPQTTIETPFICNVSVNYHYDKVLPDIFNILSDSPKQGPSYDAGGTIVLENGTNFTISGKLSEQGYLTMYFTFSDGLDTYSFWDIYNGSQFITTQESGFGTIFDYDYDYNSVHEIRIYNQEGSYDQGGLPNYDESYIKSIGLKLILKLVLKNGYWYYYDFTGD